jgi:hypothetical protein
MLSACWQVQAMPRPLIGAGLSANYLQIVVVDESEQMVAWFPVDEQMVLPVA